MTQENKTDEYLRNLKEGLNEFGQKVNRMVDDFLSGEPTSTGSLTLPWDAYETNTHYIIDIEVPGIQKRDISVQVVDGVLNLKGIKKPLTADDVIYHRRGRRYGDFFQSFELPVNIELKDIKANYENGLLRVRFPLLQPREEDDESTRIDIE
jgi:HSP20 family protein